ncbi:MAG: winged helix-turn-helix domain-containing protein, partial [Caldilineaceae bacterium]|nr:winged helix-turn-helix domain-containing protein [Caldilineaceae bacterium]
LRERIEPDPSDPIYLRTIRGVGYRLTLEHEQDMEEGGA